MPFCILSSGAPKNANWFSSMSCNSLRPRKGGLLILLVGVGLFSSLTAAGEQTEAAKRSAKTKAAKPQEVSPQKNLKAALKSLAKGDVDTALQAIRKADEGLRESASLNLSQVTVIHGEVNGLGDYYPAADGVLTTKMLRLYVEVENFAWKPRAYSNGSVFDAELDVTALFFDTEGEEMGKKSLGKRKFKTRTRHGKTFFGLEIKLGEKIPSGRYQIEIQVADVLGHKSAAKKTSFKVR